ncbi:hypothetical protein [Pseudomonas palmensis]|uniref:hypothetical protein n=1 Tax=Pseudomonas palmensis TaxID=2815362 RepID=UPI0039EA6366
MSQSVRTALGGKEIFSMALKLSPLVLVVLAGLSIFFYRDTFSGDFSTNAQDWSAFGSYVGGLFGPLVSFVALLAVLKTIELQKELLETQRREFKVMQDLQYKTFDSQQDQIDDAKKKSRLEAVERLKDTLIGAIDRRVSIYDGRYGRAYARFERYKDTDNRTSRGIASSLYDVVEKEMAVCDKNIRSLQELVSELAATDFEDVESLRAYYADRNKAIVG